MRPSDKQPCLGNFSFVEGDCRVRIYPVGARRLKVSQRTSRRSLRDLGGNNVASVTEGAKTNPLASRENGLVLQRRSS
jgi:hypothetical protein